MIWLAIRERYYGWLSAHAWRWALRIDEAWRHAKRAVDDREALAALEQYDRDHPVT